MSIDPSFQGAEWQSAYSKQNEDEIFQLAQKNNISTHLSRLLINRNIKSISKFINSKLKENLSISKIVKLSNLDSSISFFEKVKFEKKISIFSDYDVDGACAAAICKKFLSQFDIEVNVYIPNRLNEGYGLNQVAIDKIMTFSQNILVLDCGSNNIQEQEYIINKGGNIMIIDHHECEVFFDQAIVVNPKTPRDQSDLDDLCATALTFLVMVFLKHENVFPNVDVLQYLDLVALATICDLVPLSDINRSFVKQGLKVINSDNVNKGIQTLINQSKIKQKISEYHLGYILGPRINAGGRMGESLLGFNILSSDNIHQALQLAQIIESHNQNRQSIQAKIVKSINLQESEDKSINFFFDKKWHIGIVGIIAGRLMRLNNKPSFVMTSSNDFVVGSGRSLGEKNIGQLMMIAAEKGIIIKGGGHAKACGFTLREDQIPEFKNYLYEETKNISISNKKYYESTIDLNVINEQLLYDLDLLSPFGQKNPEPIFRAENVKIDILQIFKNKHAKLKIFDDLNFECEGVFFDIISEDLKFYIDKKTNFDCYFKVKKDTYSNKTVMHIEDIH
ncbi:MAG: single-stranded-DNA-specific exonuclease RecJ [Proteobacteria bacterium]|nr:single-stranded-DNA-specific exonuclease RecJ [Pseudomonadota bacterium]